MQNIRAEAVLGTTDLTDDIAFFTETLGFRMLEIFPADDPREALFQGLGLRLRLSRDAAPGKLSIAADDPVLIADGAGEITSPGGTCITIRPADRPVEQPPTEHEFVVRRLADQAPWVVGRAGMQYRDLIPDRLGGAIIASHIRIPDGGPVPDMVHYHSVGFQLIFCIRGWVDLVYEDQGPPFRLHSGNCVIQPPEIRHRVLYASDNIEVIEIGVPAEHVTTIDHDMELPTETHAPERLFSGQRFVHHKAEDARWGPFRLPAYESRDTTIAEHTGGVAGVHVIRPAAGDPVWTSHTSDIQFTFVMAGTMMLEGQGQGQGQGQAPHPLSAGDAFVIPPGMATRYATPSEDLELLEVSLPGVFETIAK